MARFKSLVLSLAALGMTIAGNAVQADDNVTIYGRVNTSLERTKVEGQPSVTQLVNNSSRLGFKGTEDLGGGVSALYLFEFGVRSDVGGFSARDTFVGLKSNLGTVKLGNITSPLYYATVDYISMHNHDTGTSGDALAWFTALGNVFVKNSVSYLTPSFNGLAAEFQYSAAGETPSATGEKPRHYSATLTYDTGPLHLGLGYGQTKNTVDFVAAVDHSKDQIVSMAAFYDFKAVVVGAMYERAKSENGAFRPGLNESHTRNYWRLAGMVPIGAHELHANYGHANDWSGTSNTGGKQWTLGYNYNLSKRTKVYALYTKIDNDSADANGLGGGEYFAPGGDVSNSIGKDFSSFGLGVRHNF